jgi:hypothetical protein
VIDGSALNSYLGRLRTFGPVVGSDSALTARSDAELNSAGQQACTELRSGIDPFTIDADLVGKGFTDKEGSIIVMTAADRSVGLCPDQWKTVLAAAGSAAAAPANP